MPKLKPTYAAISQKYAAKEKCTPPFQNSGAFSSVNSTSISRRLKSKQRFGSLVTFWSSNQIADLSLFAGNGELAKREGFFP
jgi:hypothetical protein